MFKRNQVVEAIALVLEGDSTPRGSEMRTWLKRVLETDRALGRRGRSADPHRANFAFYSEDAPGRGMENWFSGYEAFALLTSLRLMQHGWPQGFVVTVLRGVRPELERHHARILKQDPAVLFDKQLIVQRARKGDLAVDNTDPVFLGLISAKQGDLSGPISAAICRGQEQLMAFVRLHGPGQPFTSYELVNSVQALSSALAKTSPRKRGRGAE